MKPDVLERVSTLAPLSRENGRNISIPCKICGGTSYVFDVVDLNKFCSKLNFYAFGLAGVPVEYHRCDNCQFIFTTFFDDWTTDEFSKFIYNADYIQVDSDYQEIRPREVADRVAALFADRLSARILDYGSGSGDFARFMRDRGFTNVESYDPFSSPKMPSGKFDIITCFEVIEHTPTPAETFATINRFLADDGLVLIGTSLQPDNIEMIRANWWYIAPRNGHISIFSLEALAQLAQKHRLEMGSSSGGYWFRRAGIHCELPPSCRCISSVTLKAPTGIADMAWNGIENGFRWSASERLSWRIEPISTPGTLRLTIPYRMAIDAGFASNCSIEIDGARHAVSATARAITADIPISRPFDGEVALLTPPPIMPAEAGISADRRYLGIAIEV